MDLDMTPFLAAGDAPVAPQSHMYELFSIMIHSGSALGGHYYAYIKSFNNGSGLLLFVCLFVFV